MRSSTADIAINLAPPVRMTLDRFVDYIHEDELLEVTPKAQRRRKRLLDPKERKRAQKMADDGSPAGP